MASIIMVKGLPASGKTTWALEEVRKSNGKTKRINKDDLRSMLDAGEFSKANEKEILKVRDELVRRFLVDGFDVIVDDTNLAPKHLNTLLEIAANFRVPFYEKDFTDVPLNECLRRNAERANFVPSGVIIEMYNKFIKKKSSYEMYEKPEYNPDLPNCLIVDIDGTLAHMTGRSPYDYSRVNEDVVDENVRDVVYRYASRNIQEDIPDTYIIIVSGREDTCKAVTEQWLQDNQIPYDEIHMRSPRDVDEKGNQLDDRIVKKAIYEKWIKPRYNVRFVLDDRDRVVKMWREIGLKVLQVAEGDF